MTNFKNEILARVERGFSFEEIAKEMEVAINEVVAEEKAKEEQSENLKIASKALIEEAKNYLEGDALEAVAMTFSPENLKDILKGMACINKHFEKLFPSTSKEEKVSVKPNADASIENFLKNIGLM